MKKLISALLFYSFWFIAFGQNNVNYFDYINAEKASLGIQINGSFGSTVCNNEFLNKFIKGTYLDRTLIDESMRIASSKSVTGFLLEAGIKYESKIGRTFLGAKRWSLALSHQEFIAAEFPKDAFGLFFRGNKFYEGQNVLLTESGLNSNIWSSALFGLQWRRKNIEIGLQLGPAMGHQYNRIDVDHANLYTHTDGIEIESDLRLKAYSTLQSNSSLTDVNGWGYHANLSAKFIKTEHHFFTVSINNLGSIRWKNIQLREVDTLVQWRGVEIKNIFDSITTDITTLDNFKDSWIYKSQRNSYTDRLPMNINLVYQTKLREKLLVDLNLRVYLNKIPNAHLALTSQYLLSKNMAAGINLAYGNYSGFHAGCNLSLKLGNQLMMNYQANSILTAYLPNQKAYIGHALGLRWVM